MKYISITCLLLAILSVQSMASESVPETVTAEAPAPAGTDDGDAAADESDTVPISTRDALAMGAGAGIEDDTRSGSVAAGGVGARRSAPIAAAPVMSMASFTGASTSVWTTAKKFIAQAKSSDVSYIKDLTITGSISSDFWKALDGVRNSLIKLTIITDPAVNVNPVLGIRWTSLRVLNLTEGSLGDLGRVTVSIPGLATFNPRLNYASAYMISDADKSTIKRTFFADLSPEQFTMLASCEDVSYIKSLNIRFGEKSAGLMPAVLENLPHLKDTLTSLSIMVNMDGTSLMEALSSIAWKGLRNLKFYGLDVQVAGVGAIANSPNMRNLQQLSLKGCHIGDAGAESIANSENMRNLQKLSLDRAEIGDAGARAIAASPNMHNLQLLDLKSNRISDAGARAIADSTNLSNLQALYLRNTNIGDVGARAIADSTNLSNLQELDLQYTNISEAGVISIIKSKNLSSLTRLSLESGFNHMINREVLKAIAKSLDRRQKALAASVAGAAGDATETAVPVTPTLVGMPKDLQKLVGSYLPPQDQKALAVASKGLAGSATSFDMTAEEFIGVAVPGKDLSSFENLTIRLDVKSLRLMPAVLAILPYLKDTLRSLAIMVPAGSTDGRWGMSVLAPNVLVLETLRSIAWKGLRNLTVYRLNIQVAGLTAIANSANMRNLQKLSLEECIIGNSGAEIIAASENMRNLQELNLAGNLISNAGARAIGNSQSMPNLQRLFLNKNLIDDVGAIAIIKSSNLSRLKVLELEMNPISREVTTGISTSLKRRLPTSSASVTGGIGSGVSGAAASSANDALVSAASSNMALSQFIVLALSAEDLSHIKRLSIIINRDSERLMPAFLEILPYLRDTLTTLSITSEGNTDVTLLMQTLGRINWENLKNLIVYDCNVGNAGARAIGASENMRKLEELNLARNNIRGAGAEAIATSDNMRNLQLLGLTGNNIGDAGARAIVNARNMRNLKILYLDSTGISNGGVRDIVSSANVANLQSLYLANNNIGDDLANVIADSTNMRNLEHLGLGLNNIGDAGAIAIIESRNLSRLKVLDLSGNKISTETANVIRTSLDGRQKALAATVAGNPTIPAAS